jgi:hypothetical protein
MITGGRLVRDPFDREGWLFELRWGRISERLNYVDHAERQGTPMFAGVLS